MYNTIEAIYDCGKIIPLRESITPQKTRVLITFLDETSAEAGISLNEIIKYQGCLSSFPKDTVNYQRENRNEW